MICTLLRRSSAACASEGRYGRAKAGSPRKRGPAFLHISEAVPGEGPRRYEPCYFLPLGAELGTSAPGRASEKRKGAKSLNEKVYKSARELRSAIDRYFASICYREPVTRTEPVLEDREFIRNGERIVMQCPALDKYGHTQTAVVPVMRGKNPLMREVWIRPPCMPELLGALGLDEKQYSVSIPLGATINMAGAAITITVLTLATVHTLGIEVDFATALLLSLIAAVSACGASGVAGGSLLLIPLACSLFGISNDIAMQVVGVGFIIGVVQDSCETALNSSSDAIFTATAEFKKWKKEGRPIKW